MNGEACHQQQQRGISSGNRSRGSESQITSNTIHIQTWFTNGRQAPFPHHLTTAAVMLAQIVGKCRTRVFHLMRWIRATSLSLVLFRSIYHIDTTL